MANKMKEKYWQSNSSCLVAMDDEGCPIVLDKKKDALYRLVSNAGMHGFNVECFDSEGELTWRDHLGIEDLEKIGLRNQEVASKKVVNNSDAIFSCGTCGAPVESRNVLACTDKECGCWWKYQMKISEISAPTESDTKAPEPAAR